MKKVITIITGLIIICNSYQSNAQNCISEQNFNSLYYYNCGSGATTVDVTGSETGTNYFMVNAAGDTINGPFAGTGNAFTFNPGTISTSTIYHINASRPGGALSFGGANGEQVNVNNSLGNFGTTDFTVETWIYTGSSKSDMFIVAKSAACGNMAYWSIKLFGGFVLVETNNSAGSNYQFLISSATLNNNKWHHIAVVRLSNYYALYIDGNLDSDLIPPSTNLTNTANFTIGGADCDPTLAFEGKIDELRIWNTGRSQTEIQVNMHDCIPGSNAAIKADYTFEEGSGTTAGDYVNNNNGTLTNSTAVWTSGVERRHTMTYNWVATIYDLPAAAVTHSGTAFFCPGDSLKLIAKTDSNVVNFNGVDQYIDLHNAVTPLSGGDFTLEAWIRTTGTQEGILLCSNGDNSWDQGERSFYIDANGYPTFVGLGNGSIHSVQAINDGNWHHVALTWQNAGSEAHLYIDDTDQLNYSTYTSAVADIGSFTLGQPNNNESLNYFSGSLKQVRIWKTARSYYEVQKTMYDETIDLSTPFLMASYETKGTSAISYPDAKGIFHGNIINRAVWSSSNIVLEWNGNSNAAVSIYAKTMGQYNVTTHNVITGCPNTSSNITITSTVPTLTAQATVTDVCAGTSLPVTLTGSSNAVATSVTDQSQTSSSYYETATTTTRYGQSFTAGRSGALSGIVINVTNVISTGTNDYTLQIFDGNGFGGTSLFTHNFTGMPTSGIGTLPVTGVNVVAGHQYTWSVYATGGTSQVYLAMAFVDSYAGGSIYGDATLAGAGTNYGSDMYFQTIVIWTPSYSWNQSVTDHVAFVPVTSKKYTVSLTDVNGCIVKDSIDVNVNNCHATAVNSPDILPSMKAYPNPGNGVFTISSPYIDVTVQVYNSLGEIVYKELLQTGSAVLNLSSLENGVYTLKSVHSAGVNTAQLMIEK